MGIVRQDQNPFATGASAAHLCKRGKGGASSVVVVPAKVGQPPEDRAKERSLEKLALCFFAVAVFAEIAAYPYGQRNDTLSAQIIGSLDVKAQSALGKAELAEGKAKDAGMKADKADEKSGNAIATASGALAKAKAAEAILAWRDLTPKQQADIASALRQFGSKTYSLAIWGGTPEITHAVDKVVAMLTQADWTLEDWGFAMGGSVPGVLVSTEKGAPSDVVNAADALVLALNANGISTTKAPQYDHGNLPTAMLGGWKGQTPIRVFVGAKP